MVNNLNENLNMVEANPIANPDAQPQDSKTSGPDGEVSIIMDILGKRYNTAMIEERAAAL